MTAPRGRPPRFRGEVGATLAEMLTVMALSAVVLGFVTNTVVDALATQRRQTAQLAALSDAKLAFERITRDIRGADPLYAASGDRIRFVVHDSDHAVRTVIYERLDDRLVTTDESTGLTRTLVGDLSPEPRLFLFHLADGSTATGEGVLDADSVAAITVRLRVEPAGAGRVVDLENRVVMRNARL